MNNVGRRIKERREQLGLSVDDLAKMISKNRATVYRYENGEIEKLPLNVLEPIAKALQCSPAYLMGWDEELEKEKPEMLEDLDGVYLSLAQEAQKSGVSPDDIKLAIEMIRKLRGE